MKIVTNEEITNNCIHMLRSILSQESKETLEYLGTCKSDLSTLLPIRNRGYNVNIINDNDLFIGYVSYFIETTLDVFVKTLYILPEHRRQGYSYALITNLEKQYSKLYFRVNQGNESMYKFLIKNGYKGEKSSVALLSPDSSLYPVNWSKHKCDDEYIDLNI